jgi:hypothetical protein
MSRYGPTWEPTWADMGRHGRHGPTWADISLFGPSSTKDKSTEKNQQEAGKSTENHTPNPQVISRGIRTRIYGKTYVSRGFQRADLFGKLGITVQRVISRGIRTRIYGKTCFFKVCFFFFSEESLIDSIGFPSIFRGILDRLFSERILVVVVVVIYVLTCVAIDVAILVVWCFMTHR